MSPIHLDADSAAYIVQVAADDALEQEGPAAWRAVTQDLGAAKTKTYIAALGTALLARATDSRIDPMSIKATPSRPRAYSARSLCHGVLVPASREYGFDLGVTGREPLNNQPFFRYERVDEMERVRDQAGLRVLLTALRKVGKLDSNDARLALTAFIRARMDVADKKRHATLKDVDLSVREIIEAATTFVSEGAEGGKRGQALVAGVLDVVFADVRMGRVNDPSRRFPGDVQAMDGVQVVLAVEVRQKDVTADDALAFARVSAEAGVANAAVVALPPGRTHLHPIVLRDLAEDRHGVLLTVIQSVGELISAGLVWCGTPTNLALLSLPQLVVDRLEEIEASERSISRWTALVEGAG